MTLKGGDGSRRTEEKRIAVPLRGATFGIITGTGRAE